MPLLLHTGIPAVPSLCAVTRHPARVILGQVLATHGLALVTPPPAVPRAAARMVAAEVIPAAEEAAVIPRAAAEVVVEAVAARTAVVAGDRTTRTI